MWISNRYSTGGYWLTVILTMVLSILPLPIALDSYNPDWVLLGLIYWILAMPERIGVFHACLLGLLVDVLTGRSLGLHAHNYALIGYTCLKLHKRLRQYPLLQQAFFVFLSLLFSQTLIFWIENIQGNINVTVSFWLPVLTGALFWPLVYVVLRFIRTMGRFG